MQLTALKFLNRSSKKELIFIVLYNTRKLPKKRFLINKSQFQKTLSLYLCFVIFIFKTKKFFLSILHHFSIYFLNF